MSKGPGAIERRIAELFHASGREGDDRSFTIAELAGAVFGVDVPTRAQKVSVTRAARAALRRTRKARDRQNDLDRKAHNETTAKLGREPRRRGYDSEWYSTYREHPAKEESRSVPYADHVPWSWRETKQGDGTIVFHDRYRPMRVWAVTIDRNGVHWFDADIIKITRTCVSVVYKGERAPLKRPIYTWGAWWRGVRFVAERDGAVAAFLENIWREQFGHLIPADLMPLDRARQLLGLPAAYTEGDVIAGFRKAAKRCHPDMGGTAEAFRELVKARDRLLASIGTSAPAPKEPDFTPSGYRTRYVSISSHTRRIGGSRRRLLAS